jgi:hypothetical protein
MGNNGIIVHLGLDDMLKESFGEDHQELRKNIGTDKSILVRDVYDYMINPEKDELNPDGYTPEQVKTAHFIEREYGEVQHTPNFIYETNAGRPAFMHFNEKLSKYPDAFHLQNQGNVEFGNLEEQVTEEHVYLKATDQAMGGK